ncbi:hypothetical protein MHI39_08315 [Heyndrickxia sp. FSL K6-6286]|uniref:hypothetical protein n=1 Tax=Heyndrickxia sp. FSL K6-6286 TaxID=2921510 RepID=UPI0003A0C882
MKKRDLEIIQSLEKFKCLERDQIAALHFQKNKRPHVIANGVLRRLRMAGYIQANTDRAFQQYIYFPVPSSMKINSQKIDHYLMIAQGYIDLNRMSPVTNYDIEPKIKDADFIPDVICEWMGKKYFIEYQNSLYTAKQMHQKINKYIDYFNKGNWNDERLLIVGKINLKFDTEDYPIKIKQVKDINELKRLVEKVKEKTIKSVNGRIEFTL